MDCTSDNTYETAYCLKHPQRGEGYVSFAQPQQGIVFVGLCLIIVVVLLILILLFANMLVADKAIAQLDHSMLKGKLIHVAKSDFSFNKVAVELSDDIEDHKSNEELTKIFSHFGPIIRTQQFAHQPGERYLFLTFEDHQGAARAATALDNCKFLDHLMALSYIALVDPEEEDKAHREKFGKCASSQWMRKQIGSEILTFAGVKKGDEVQI
ncbi:hypothetical protein OROMI_014567 [Orobanche minor]